ncbi:cbb3-type cytochrome oxidase assembly protein [Salipaludibacillus sp. CUR1]|uniref:cbb3-type cytochrome oxidase assembly protein CcoS n=1 Tax=Salipaludibacillus sp. CUR1 TaxID=2820003 RepID=UPI001E489297|nr:cbb3-type cytochrome oxidase assembly protein CcoS [Salipaludibacillus sp. CUR1]MCE7794286.1 cbb3-type cytochrome oxidase assembly protein [Salipaludibacillus sp. CUR1]
MNHVQLLASMTVQAWVLLITMLSLSGAAILMFVWGKRTGQFNNTEDISRKILEIEEEEESY